MRVATLKRMMARPTFEEELELHRVDCLASHGMLDNHATLLAKREEFGREPLIPKPLITGDDLIALGWKPGPRFAEILSAIQTLVTNVRFEPGKVFCQSRKYNEQDYIW